VGGLAKRMFEAFGMLSPAESVAAGPLMEGKRAAEPPPHTPPTLASRRSHNSNRAGKTY
jgi:hypothetical protein